MNYPKAHLVDRSFNYTPSEQTNIADRFERERARIRVNELPDITLLDDFELTERLGYLTDMEGLK